MSRQLNPWMRCPDCEKLHMRLYVSPTTVCKCGRSLWPVAWGEFVKPRTGGAA